jgi:polyphosphate kinase
VVSVVGRFLEHSRIYSFERPDDSAVFIGSADLMPRNLYNRVELLTPVEDRANGAQLMDVLDRAFADNTGSWELGADGVWSRRSVNGDEPRALQQELLRVHAERAEAVARTTL